MITSFIRPLHYSFLPERFSNCLAFPLQLTSRSCPKSQTEIPRVSPSFCLVLSLRQSPLIAISWHFNLNKFSK